MSYSRLERDTFPISPEPDDWNLSSPADSVRAGARPCRLSLRVRLQSHLLSPLPPKGEALVLMSLWSLSVLFCFLLWKTALGTPSVSEMCFAYVVIILGYLYRTDRWNQIDWCRTILLNISCNVSKQLSNDSIHVQAAYVPDPPGQNIPATEDSAQGQGPLIMANEHPQDQNWHTTHRVQVIGHWSEINLAEQQRAEFFSHTHLPFNFSTVSPNINFYCWWTPPFWITCWFVLKVFFVLSKAENK